MTRTRSRFLRAALAAAMLWTAAGAMLPVAPALAAKPDREQQRRFMWAMAGQESGWDYYARNAWSGAYGKYQIMPFNWSAWAARYLGDAQADQTPRNQERVASGKIADLYRWLGSWKRVAYWWLTGSDDPREKRWSSYARGYARNIMRLRERAPRDVAALPAWTSSRAERGDWRTASERLRLRTGPSARRWPRRGRIEAGERLRVQRSARLDGVRWVAVVTIDGRLGWLRQLDTVPARRPAHARRWRDIDDRGPGTRDVRRHVRPRPR